MSLQYWWPLHGDLTEKIQGNDFVITYNSGKINGSSSGKLYKNCYTLVATNNTDHLRSKNKIPAMTDQTIAAWVYVNTLANTSTANGVITNHDHNTCTGMGITLKAISASDARMSCNTGNGSSRTYHDYYGTTNIKGGWHHLCLVYNSTAKNIKLYVDGVCEKTQSYTMAFKEDYLDVFNWSTTYNNQSSYRPACSVEDVRVYSHPLSEYEVKELAKGLAIHYSFDDVNSPNPNNQNTGTGWSSFTSYWTISSQSASSLVVQRPSSSTNTTLALSNSTLFGKMAAGESWCMSCYLYVNGQPYKTSCTDISTYGGFVETDSESREDGYYRVNFNLTNKDSGWIFHTAIFGATGTGVTCELRNLQFYKTASISNETGVVQPSSTTTLLYSKNNRIGKNCALFNGSTSCVDTPVLKSDMFTSPYTLNFWVYPTDGDREVYFGDYSTSGAINLNFERKADGAFRYYHNGNPDKTCTNLTIPVNTWTMVTVTYTPGTMRFYKNGSLIETYSHTATLTKTSGFMRIGRDNRSDVTALGGRMDDFRFYVTCLSSNDISQLYSSSLQIGRVGDTHTSFIEERDVTTSCSSKKGVRKLNYLTEVIEYKGGFYLQVSHHNNKGGTNLFSSGDAFESSFVYHNDECWSAFPLIKNHGLYNGAYEFIAIEQLGTTDNITLRRWKQTVSPFTATYATAKKDGGNFTALENIPSMNGGMYKLNSNTYFCITNATNGNWYGAFGSWNKHGSGIPTFNNSSSAGIFDLFVRVSPADAQKYREFKSGMTMPFEIEEI